MKKIQIKDKAESCLEFLERRVLTPNVKIFISNDIFSEIWKECESFDGCIDIEQPKIIPTKSNPYGIYCFSYIKKDYFNNLFDTKIVIKNNGIIKSHKQLQIVAVRSRNLTYTVSPEFLSSTIYLTRKPVKQTFLGIEL